MDKPLDSTDRSKPLEFPLPGVDFCFEPLPEKPRVKGPPQTSLDAMFARYHQDDSARSFARGRVAMEPLLLLQVRDADRRQQADVLMELALSHYLVGDLGRGRSWTEQAILLWQQVGDGRMMLECLMRSAHFYQRAGDVKEAIGFYERLLTHDVPAFGPPARYNVLMAVSELHSYQDNLPGATDAMRRAVAIAPRLGSPPQLRMAQMGLSLFLFKAQRWPEALEAGLVALAQARQDGDRDTEENMRFLLADCYRELGQHRESALQFEVMLQKARAARAPRQLMVELLMKAGTAWRLAGERERAGGHFRELLPLADKESGSRPLGVAVRLNLAMVLQEGGEPRAALRLLDEAMVSTPPELRPAVLMARGETHIRLQQWDEAASAYQQALALARQRGDAQQEAELLTRLTLLHARDAEEQAAAN